MAFRGASLQGISIAICMALLSACGSGSNGSGSSSSSGGVSSSSSSSSSSGSSSSGSSSGSASAGPYTLTNLVADKANLISDGSASASHVDPNLVNPWGLVFGTGAPSWTSNEGSSTSTLYDGLGDSIPLVVKLPANGTKAASPTGIVFNTSSTDFVIGSGTAAGPASFIFDGLNGSVYGWSESAGAVLAYSATDGAVYTGLAFASNGSGNFIYAADFKNNKIDVLNNAYKLVSVSGTAGSFPFTDPKLPSGYAPYGIQAISSGGTTQIYVAYAEASGSTPSSSSSSSGSGSSSSSSSSSGGYGYAISAERATAAIRATPSAANIPGAGLGQIDVYDTSGNFVKTLVAAGGVLNGPWGMALAPSDFGALGGDLLVGNFGDTGTDNGSGAIDAFNPSTGAFVGAVSDAQGNPLAIPGVWALAFGNGAAGLNQPLNTLFFTAGSNAETDGTYGRIDAGATAPSFPSAVSISAPAAGATVSGTAVAVSASVQDVNAVSQVQFFAGGTSIGTAKSAPFTVSWDSTKSANGTVALTATALDADSNTLTSAALSVSVNNAAAPPPAVTLTQLQTQFFTPICSVCHNGSSSFLPGVQNLTAGNSFSNIVNVASIEVPSLDRIKPNDPTNSYMIKKLMGTQGAGNGSQMPLGCGSASDPCLTQAQINMFISWVNAGAQNN